MDNTQDRETIPVEQAPVHPSRPCSKLNRWLSNMHLPSSLIYYVKAARLWLLDFLVSLPWRCVVLMAVILPITSIAEMLLLPTDCSTGNHSHTNMSTEPNNQRTDTGSFAGLIPLPLNLIFLTFFTNLFAMILFTFTSAPTNNFIRRKIPGLHHRLARLIDYPVLKDCHWLCRVLTFLAMAAITYTTSDWFWLAFTALSNEDCPSPMAIVLLRMALYLYASMAVLSTVLFSTLIFPSGHALEEFEQAVEQRLKLRQIAGMEVYSSGQSATSSTD